MKASIASSSKLVLSLVLALVAQALPTWAAPAPSAPKAATSSAAAGKTPAKSPGDSAAGATNVTDVWLEPIPQSAFAVPATPKEGRNPFFPQSLRKREVPRPQTVGPAPVVETYTFVLNGLTSPPLQTAIINGRTFEPGEEAEVKMPNGKKLVIKCLEVRADSAIISFGGQQRELRMRSGL